MQIVMICRIYRLLSLTMNAELSFTQLNVIKNTLFTYITKRIYPLTFHLKQPESAKAEQGKRSPYRIHILHLKYQIIRNPES